jgi:hypothetical protein
VFGIKQDKYFSRFLDKYSSLIIIYVKAFLIFMNFVLSVCEPPYRIITKDILYQSISCIRLQFFRRKRHQFSGLLSKNPFLSIRGISCPCCVQASFFLNYLKLTIPGFPYNCLPVSCGGIGFYKNPTSSIGLEIRTQSDFTALRALLPSVNYFAE